MANFVKALGCLSGWVIILGLGPVNAAAPSSDWKAGAARVDTTPTAPVWMAGYGSRSKPSQGVDHPLAAKALALADANDNKAVFVTCDIINFQRAFTARVTARVKAKHGLPRENIVLIASHTHTGPILSDDIDEKRTSDGREREGFQNNVDYTKELENKIVDLVGQALGKMEPASLSYGVGRAHFALNRREVTERGTIKLGKNPLGPTDESVPILRVQNAGGKPLAIMFGYACHNTTLRPNAMKLGGDYASYAQDRIEADNPGAVSLFVTGCAGDADPHPFGTLDMAKDHGEELGEAVKFVLEHPAWLTSLSGPLRSAFAESTVHFSGPTDRASLENLLNDSSGGRKRHIQHLIENIDGGKPVRADYPYGVQAFAIGDQLTMVALSGEVVVDYAIRLQRELGGKGKDLWVAAYANDVVGYIPSVRVLKEGGYEGGDSFFGSNWPAPFAEDIESIVVKTAHEVVDEVRRK
jgi:Neutral/alkaline non-lysosomal ceramidase, N-terminal